MRFVEGAGGGGTGFEMYGKYELFGDWGAEDGGVGAATGLSARRGKSPMGTLERICEWGLDDSGSGIWFARGRDR